MAALYIYFYTTYLLFLTHAVYSTPNLRLSLNKWFISDSLNSNILCYYMTRSMSNTPIILDGIVLFTGAGQSWKKLLIIIPNVYLNHMSTAYVLNSLYWSHTSMFFLTVVLSPAAGYQPRTHPTSDHAGHEQHACLLQFAGVCSHHLQRPLQGPLLDWQVIPDLITLVNVMSFNRSCQSVNIMSFDKF